MKNNKSKSELPAYVSMVYEDVYNNIERCQELDSKFSAKLRTFFQYDKLISATLAGITQNQTVLQLGQVFGYEIDEVAQIIGAYGKYDVIDINPFQVARNQEKYGHIYPCLKIFKQDASTMNIEGEYDVVICFMLLQELPSATKSKVINNALRAVKPGGQVIFVDYHKPYPWHPLRYWVRMYNRIKHPFAEKLWDKGIETYANKKSAFIWRKSTYFGGMFQRLIATKKSNPIEEALEFETKKSEDLSLYKF